MFFFFFKQKTAYEMRISDWSSDVCSSDLKEGGGDKIARIAMDLQLLLGEGGLKVSVSGREKHPYSIWKKMQERHISFEQLTDVMAFRVITERAEDCYRALGIIHQRYKMVPGRFKDRKSTRLNSSN